MTWAYFDDPVQGPTVLTADGLVLEWFRHRSGDTSRVHAAMAEVAVTGPDSKGRYTIEVVNRTPHGRGSGFQVLVDADGLTRATPVIEAFATAAAAAGLR